MPVLNRIAEFHNDMTAWRQHLHAHPELGYETVETAAFVAARLREFGVDEVHEGIARNGVIALLLVMALMAEAIALYAADAAAFVALAVLSRVAMVGVLSVLPAARTDGLGDAAAGAAQWHVALAALYPAGAATLLGRAGLAVDAGKLIAAASVAVLAKRALGGQTGDVLGATQMVTEAVGWCILVVLI